MLRPSLILFAALSILTGVVYPLAVTGIAQAVFPSKANGSVIFVGEKAVGSHLIGQPFSSPGHFWSRPSATSAMPYDASASTGSNLGPINPALIAAVHDRVAALKAADPTLTGPIPVDLVTSSGSGLDPEISVAAALCQVNRVAKARGLAADEVRRMVIAQADATQLGNLLAPRVNVLELNLALDHVAAR
jgi:potassium-transporting ATPase KdpC subunit